jgi:glycosyltransferase involved in cell wall biosynthesis
MSPKVSVVMPVYNAEEYLVEAIESILNQAFTDFEFIVIDDGSTDSSADILRQYEVKDKRICAIIRENRGQSITLNEGIYQATGQYIAIMHADDISLPTRLDEQISFMDIHPEYGIVGTWVRMVGTANEILRHPVNNDSIACRLLFHCVLVHPSVMIRREHFLESGLSYDADFITAQDYDLWARAAAAFPIANIPKILIHYRIHPQQTIQVHNNKSNAEIERVQTFLLQQLGVNPSVDEQELHRQISQMSLTHPTKDFIQQAEVWLQRLYLANQQKNIYPESQFSELLTERWFMIGYHVVVPLGWGEWLHWMRSSLSKNVSLLNKIKVLKQCVVNSLKKWPLRHD